jgi:hypothetical protein
MTHADLERRALVATGSTLPWPAPASLVVTFIAHHLSDAAKKEGDPEHGMPDDVAGMLRTIVDRSITMLLGTILTGNRTFGVRLPVC